MRKSSKLDRPLPLQSPIKLLLHLPHLRKLHEATGFTLKMTTQPSKRRELLVTVFLVGTVVDLFLVGS